MRARGNVARIEVPNPLPRTIVLVALASSLGCSRPATPTGVCDRLPGMWTGDGLEADGGQDPDALRVMTEVVRAEQWRLTRVLPTAMQRERVGASGGPLVGDALYIRENSATRCVVEITNPRGSRTMTMTPRPDGRLEAHTAGAWFNALYRRREQ